MRRRSPEGCHFQMRIGRSTFLTETLPPSTRSMSTLVPMLSFTIEATQMPPGSASGSRRAATLTPSP